MNQNVGENRFERQWVKVIRVKMESCSRIKDGTGRLVIEKDEMRWT